MGIVLRTIILILIGTSCASYIGWETTHMYNGKECVIFTKDISELKYFMQGRALGFKDCKEKWAPGRQSVEVTCHTPTKETWVGTNNYAECLKVKRAKESKTK